MAKWKKLEKEAIDKLEPCPCPTECKARQTCVGDVLQRGQTPGVAAYHFWRCNVCGRIIYD
jgi:hypothetical protein